jgi:hypothetical protein
MKIACFVFVLFCFALFCFVLFCYATLHLLFLYMQEMRRDMTRSHRKSVEKSPKRAKFFNSHLPVFSGTLKECLAAKCCDHLSDTEKHRVVSLIIAAFATSAEKDFANMLGDKMIEQQQFTVADLFST